MENQVLNKLYNKGRVNCLTHNVTFDTSQCQPVQSILVEDVFLFIRTTSRKYPTVSVPAII